jgi:hypothetical protein
VPATEWFRDRPHPLQLAPGRPPADKEFPSALTTRPPRTNASTGHENRPRVRRTHAKTLIFACFPVILLFNGLSHAHFTCETRDGNGYEKQALHRHVGDRRCDPARR